MENLVFFVSLGIAPPLALALFKQTSTAKVNGLESNFHNLTDSKGQAITELFYNKGL